MVSITSPLLGSGPYSTQTLHALPPSALPHHVLEPFLNLGRDLIGGFPLHLNLDVGLAVVHFTELEKRFPLFQISCQGPILGVLTANFCQLKGDPQPDRNSVFGNKVPVEFAEEGSTSKSHHTGLEVSALDQTVRLQLSEKGFSPGFKDSRNRFALFFFNQPIQIMKWALHLTGQDWADGRFSTPHESYKINVLIHFMVSSPYYA